MAASVATKAEMYTVVENLLDNPRTFSHLGSQGMRLGAHEVVAIPGNIITAHGAAQSRRKFKALERSLARKRLRIRATPSPILYDPVDETPKSLAIQGGALGLVDPTYASSDSEFFTEV